MSDQIRDLLESYVKENPGFKINPEAEKHITANTRSFRSLVSDKGYLMKVELSETRTLSVQFASEAGQIYTTYGFNNAVIPV